jgi:SPP1 family predicted phage head-tail adaptor
MANYKPRTPFNVPMFLYIPTTTTVKGSEKKTYPAQGETIFCSFRTFGGTETTVNGVLVVENTATVETWYRPDIKSDCVLKDVSGLSYEILGTPEDIEQRHQFLRFKVRAIKGGV